MSSPIQAQADQPFLLVSGNFFFKYRDLVFPLVLIPLLIIFPPQQLNHSDHADLLMDSIGLLIGLLGETFRVGTVGLQYIIRGGLNKKVHADDLVTGGIFAHCRNPLYVGNLLMIYSLLIVSNNPVVYVLGGFFFTYVYISIVKAEETFLQNKFGAKYIAYCDSVNRWMPNLKGLLETFSGMRFNWRRVLVKEYSSFFPWCAGITILYVWQLFCFDLPVPIIQARLVILATVLAIEMILYVLLRTLKKTGRLTETRSRQSL